MVRTDRVPRRTRPDPKAAPKRLSEARGISLPSAKETPAASGAGAVAKPEAESASVGFFGDPKKFTRLGGWGSFGNAMGQFGFAKSTLIMMPPVQEELKLTASQKEDLRKWQDTMRKRGEEMGRAMREKNGDGDPFRGAENQPIAARVVQFTSMMNQFSTILRENETGLGRILNAPQRKRLNQISLQMEGISALTKPEIVEALGMTEEELEMVQQVLTRSRAMQMTTWIGSMMAMRPNRQPPADPKANTEGAAKKDASPPGDPPAGTVELDAKAKADREKAMRQRFESMRDQSDQIQNRAVREITNILSKAQRAKFENLLGPPFDPKKINNFGRPPGPPAEKPAEGEPAVKK